MPTTRSATGHSAPRIVQQIEAAITPGTTKKRTTKANTSKPRDKTVASGRVGKTAAPKKSTTTTTTKTTKKKSPVKKAVDKVAGKTEKAVGDVEGKPGKKAAGEKKSKSTTTSKATTTKTKGKVVA